MSVYGSGRDRVGMITIEPKEASRKFKQRTQGMRVAMVDPSLFTLPYDEALCSGLCQAGLEIRLYGRAYRAGERADVSAVTLHPSFYHFEQRLAGLPRKMFLAGKGLDHIASMRRFLKDVHRFCPAVIHFQWLVLPFIDIPFLKALRRRFPLVLTVHDTDAFNATASSPLQYLGAKAIWNYFDHLIVHTKTAVSKLIAHGIEANRISLIPHGVLELDGGSSLVNEWDPGVDSPRLQAVSGQITDMATTFLLLGRLRPYKGVDLLIRAAATMSPKALAASRFIVAGKPYVDVDSLVKLAEQLGVIDSFEFRARYIEEGEVASLLRRTSVFVFPYRRIEASGVLMGSLALGKPIVASNIGIFAELLTDGVHGRLVPPEDIPCLGEAIEQLALDSKMQNRMGRSVATLYSDLPSWNEISSQTARLYWRLSQDNGGDRRLA